MRSRTGTPEVPGACCTRGGDVDRHRPGAGRHPERTGDRHLQGLSGADLRLGQRVGDGRGGTGVGHPNRSDGDETVAEPAVDVNDHVGRRARVDADGAASAHSAEHGVRHHGPAQEVQGGGGRDTCTAREHAQVSGAHRPHSGDVQHHSNRGTRHAEVARDRNGEHLPGPHGRRRPGVRRAPGRHRREAVAHPAIEVDDDVGGCRGVEANRACAQSHDDRISHVGGTWVVQRRRRWQVAPQGTPASDPRRGHRPT